MKDEDQLVHPDLVRTDPAPGYLLPLGLFLGLPAGLAVTAAGLAAAWDLGPGIFGGNLHKQLRNSDWLLELILTPVILLLGLALLAAGILLFFSWWTGRRGLVSPEERRWQELATSVYRMTAPRAGAITLTQLHGLPGRGHSAPGRHYVVTLVQEESLVLDVVQSSAPLQALFRATPHGPERQDPERDWLYTSVSEPIPARLWMDEPAAPKIVVIESGGVRIWASCGGPRT